MSHPADPPDPAAPAGATDHGLAVRFDDEPDAPTPDPWGAKLRRWGRDLVVSVGGAGLLFAAIGWLRAPDLPAEAPAFTLPSLTGEQVSLASLRGQTVVLNFWATWCGPCQLEMPELVGFADRNPDVPVLFVAVDGEVDALRAFADSHGLPAARVLRADAAVKRAYGVSTLPTTVVVEPDGAVRAAHAGIVLLPQLWWWTR